jgi:hypothetical protein
MYDTKTPEDQGYSDLLRRNLRRLSTNNLSVPERQEKHRDFWKLVDEKRCVTATSGHTPTIATMGHRASRLET